ncbi:hypothetical protein [Haloarchaeobius amylolyticus]|uniref:hypothetical protein n=1 Tax=Haloarchaeobius amylolyticus TaxID=1198296 RepID=UPI0022707456|nr:hypothetical protein [Haloarchaeobius amylolyticus]
MATPSKRFGDDEVTLEASVDTGAAFVMLMLAQMVLLFTFWITLWPTAFGIPQDVRLMSAIGGFFTGAAVLGLYGGIKTLMQQTVETGA